MAAVGSLAARNGGRNAALRNLAWLMTDKALALVFGLLVFGLIARAYGPVGSGHFAFALALLQTALGLSLVCSAVPLLPRMCRLGRGIGGMVANVFLIRMGGALVSALCVALFAVFTISDPQRLAITLIVLASVPLIEPLYTAVAYWQSRNDNRPPTITRGAGLLTRAALVFIAIAMDLPLWVVAFAWLAEAMVSAALQTRSIAHLGTLPALARRVTPHRSSTLFRFGVRFFAGLALAGLYVRLDRIFLAEHLPEHEFGLYAAGMQLVDVWLQVGSLIGFAVGPAFLYAAVIAGGSPWRHWRAAMMLAGAGITGLLVVLAFGDVALRVVFGRAFDGSYPFLVAGVAFGVLLFVDQLVGMTIAATNQPLALMIKWGAACIVALATMWLAFPTLGAFAGPTGLSVGVVASWLAAAVALKGRKRRPPPTGAPA
jgi:O-antigen/teichoic acid export membrane protein